MPETYRRELTIDSTRVDQQARTVEASLSSEKVVRQMFGLEKLSHDPQAIDLSRATDGLPWLFGHDQDAAPIGLAEGIKLIGKRLRATLRFGRTA